jgi:hypothetical protein
MKKNLGVLILLLVVLVFAGYYGYSQWKKMQPPPIDPNQMYNPYLPPQMPAPGAHPTNK